MQKKKTACNQKLNPHTLTHTEQTNIHTLTHTYTWQIKRCQPHAIFMLHPAITFTHTLAHTLSHTHTYTFLPASRLLRLSYWPHMQNCSFIQQHKHCCAHKFIQSSSLHTNTHSHTLTYNTYTYTYIYRAGTVKRAESIFISTAKCVSTSLQQHFRFYFFPTLT